MSSQLHCLVTGGSGYIGGRLVPELLAAGHEVRCLARDPGKLGERPWSDEVEIARGDAMDLVAVRRALEGIDVAYYLVHSLGSGGSFEQRDRAAARVFADAAATALPRPYPSPGAWRATFRKDPGSRPGHMPSGTTPRSLPSSAAPVLRSPNR